jgi:hypothetical protein
MEARVEGLRRKYEAFRFGREDVLALIDETRAFLEEVRKSGRTKLVEELEDMLIDLEFSQEEMI